MMDDESGTPRRSAREKRITLKGKEFQEYQRKKIQETEDNEEYEFSGDEVQITDTVSNILPGKEIYSFKKVKKHERIISTPEVLPPKTPHYIRKKIKRGIKKTLKMEMSSDEEPFTDSGSEYECNESSEDSDVDVNIVTEESDEEIIPVKTVNKKFQKLSVTQRSSRLKNQEYNIKVDEYFSNNASNKATTSNHTLDKLKTPRLSQKEVQNFLSETKISKIHKNCILNLTKNSQGNFGKWLCLLHENFNILLFGLGSKKKLMDQFQQEILKGLPSIVVNGFFPSLTLKDIVDSILHDFLEIKESPASVFDACDLIQQQFELIPEQHLYLIIHNIDGDMLRNNKTQNVLAKLSNIKNIHLVASIDHINAPLMWDHNKLSKFNFIWWDATTFLPYMDETSYETSMMIHRTGNLALSSLRNVFLSLTSNSKGIYMIILKYQLENNTNQYYQGLSFKNLYRACRDAFLVSSDLSLRAQLTEFIDHNMVKMKRTADGGEHLIIPISNHLLQQFLNEQT